MRVAQHCTASRIVQQCQSLSIGIYAKYNWLAASVHLTPAAGVPVGCANHYTVRASCIEV